MKKLNGFRGFSAILLCILVAAVLCSCPDGSGPGNGNSPPGDTTTVSGSSLAAKLNWVKSNARSNTTYQITVNANENLKPQDLDYSGKDNIILKLEGAGSVRTITIDLSDITSPYSSTNCNLFRVGSGVTLILGNNITLQGSSGAFDSLVRVFGSFIMKPGAKIMGNTIGYFFNGSAGGVHVDYKNVNGTYMGGTFTMEGGEISGNTASTSNSNGGSGGVHVDTYGTFSMKGGKISGNTDRYCGGVDVGGTFTMEGGEISGNTASSGSGGGVHVDRGGTFSMKGGKISANTASSGSGGGVYVGGTFTMDSGTFTMEGGEIYGNTATYGGGVRVDGGGTFTMEGGKIWGKNYGIKIR